MFFTLQNINNSPMSHRHQDVSRLGVTCVETPEGVTEEAWEEGAGRGCQRRSNEGVYNIWLVVWNIFYFPIYWE